MGFFVRHDDEWDWLRSFLTVDKVKALLGPEYNGGLVERFEIPHIRAVSLDLMGLCTLIRGMIADLMDLGPLLAP